MTSSLRWVEKKSFAFVYVPDSDFIESMILYSEIYTDKGDDDDDFKCILIVKNVFTHFSVMHFHVCCSLMQLSVELFLGTFTECMIHASWIGLQTRQTKNDTCQCLLNTLKRLRQLPQGGELEPGRGLLHLPHQ